MSSDILNITQGAAYTPEETGEPRPAPFAYTLDPDPGSAGTGTGGAVAMDLNEGLYPLDAIYGAAYLFIDRCFVFLERPSDAVVRVRLSLKRDPRQDQSEGEGNDQRATLHAMAGELANELLNQVLRLRIGQSTQRIREYYLAKAFFAESSGSSSIDALLRELDEEELAEDALAIPRPPTGEERG